MSEMVEKKEKLSALEIMQEMRGIAPENACMSCSGAGSKLYGSSATWHGGIGGQAVTSDVCDVCWGSGDRTRPWTNLRTLSAYAPLHVTLKRYLASEAGVMSNAENAELEGLFSVMRRKLLNAMSGIGQELNESQIYTYRKMLERLIRLLSKEVT